MMMNTEAETTNNNLDNWLRQVSRHLEVRRAENRSRPRPKRNRERERARREARQLFADWYAERAVALAS